MDAKDIVDNGISNGKIIQPSHIDNLYQKLFLNTVIITDYIVTDNYGIIFCDATTASLTATLPDAETNFNDAVIFQKIDNTENTITIKDINGNTISNLRSLNDRISCHSYLNNGVYGWIVGDSNIKPYKVYNFSIVMNGSSPPTITVYENTLGDVVWARTSTAEWTATLSGASANFFFYGYSPNTYYLFVTDTTRSFRIFQDDINSFRLRCYTSNGQSISEPPTGSTLFFEVRVYS